MTEDEDLPLEHWAIGMHPKDVNFVREFLVDMNAYQALIRCGTLKATASGKGTQILRRPVIAKAIAAAMHDRAQLLGITAKTVLAEAFRCYLQCVQEKKWVQAARFLDMCGRHVDVKAFKDRVGLPIDDDDDREDSEGLANLSLEELHELARLSRKARGDADDQPEAAPLRH